MSEEIIRNTLKYTNEGGRNRLVLNGRDIAGEVEKEGFSITLDQDTLQPVLTVRYVLDDIEADLEDVTVEDATP